MTTDDWEASARTQLAAVAGVLRRHRLPAAERIDAVLEGSDAEVEAFLLSGELWGKKGSIVYLAGMVRSGEARQEIKEAFRALGEWQITRGCVDRDVEGWMRYFDRLGPQPPGPQPPGGQVLAPQPPGGQPLDPQPSGGLQDGRGGQAERIAVSWSVRDVWLAVLVAALIVGGAYGLVYLLSALSVRPNLDLWVALAPALLELLFLVPVWWFSLHKYRAPLRALGFVKFRFSVVGAGIGLLLAFYMFNGFYAFLLDQFGLRPQSDLTPVWQQLSTPWPLILTTVVVAPVVEETFFRGFVFAGLRRRYDWRWAAVISSVLFAAVHLDLTFFIPAFLLGYLFAYLYQCSRSVWPGIVIHALVNTIGVSLYWLL